MITRKRFLTLAALPLFAALGSGAQQPANQETQRFMVLRAVQIAGASQELTEAQANCVITGSGDDAAMQCRPVGVNAKNYYNYYAALVVNADGTAHIIACRIALFTNRWCRKLSPGRILRGSVANGRFALLDAEGDKPNEYLILLTKSVGAPASRLVPLEAGTPAPAGSPASAPPPASSSSSLPAQNGAAGSAAPGSTSNIANDPSATCMSYTAACVSFVSEPPGADIYVDGKFVGNTPSLLPLSPGAHEIRVEDGRNKSWTRSFEATAGSRVTIRATLQASAPGQ